MAGLLTPGRRASAPRRSASCWRRSRERSDWVPALLTGNTTGMARIKLDHFGITDQFAFGAFGEEAADRNALAQVAVTRARER